MKQRLQKILASRGVASRRKAEEMIAAGRVTCNGAICRVGDSADDAIDEILLDGRPLPSVDKHVYIMLHKPRGYVTTMSDEKGRKDVTLLVSDCPYRVYPVGRLDMDSEGLLIMTNDGDFANKLMHPKHEINKTYRVMVDGFSAESLEKLKQPIELDGYRICPPEVVVSHYGRNDNKAELVITIHEGRNRQVRRMCAHAGMTVKRLLRICEGGLSLDDLPSGTWRYLTDDEVRCL